MENFPNDSSLNELLNVWWNTVHSTQIALEERKSVAKPVETHVRLMLSPKTKERSLHECTAIPILTLVLEIPNDSVISVNLLQLARPIQMVATFKHIIIPTLWNNHRHQGKKKKDISDSKQWSQFFVSFFKIICRINSHDIDVHWK